MKNRTGSISSVRREKIQIARRCKRSRHRTDQLIVSEFQRILSSFVYSSLRHVVRIQHRGKWGRVQKTIETVHVECKVHADLMYEEKEGMAFLFDARFAT